MTLNMYNHHFSLVTHMQKYTQFHMCTKCRHLFQSAYNLPKHTNIKKDFTKVGFIYLGGIYRNKTSVCKIETPPDLHIYPYKIVCDFDSYFSRSENQAEPQSANTQLDCHHVPLSASVASDFPQWENPVCFIESLTMRSYS